MNARLDEALFHASAESSVVDGTKAPVHLTFEYQDKSGLRARKEFVLEPNSYIVQFTSSVALGDRVFNPTMVWGPALGDAATSGETSRYLQKPEAIFFADTVQRVAATQLTPDKCQGARTENGCAWENAFRFAGVDDHYFVSAVLPKGRLRIEYQPAAVQITVPPSRGVWETVLSAIGLGGPAPTAPQTITNELVGYSAKAARATPGMRVFVGPKDFDVLAAADPQMVRIINFGMFSWLAVPLLRALKSINGYVGNYGWAIIILTILINAAMFPLRHKSMVSMRKLQQIQPEIKAIQDRYAKLKVNDPARGKMNTEMMALYREKGVNPASGCLPMLLTMPVLFAFYAMLGQAIEVRGAPFAFWLQDLSRRDPYYVLPVLMGLTMLWQQKMTPSSVDPAQQKMMMFMPIMFTAFFLWAPSGLALYFLLSNLLAIGQQYLTNNLISPAPAPRGKGRGGTQGQGSKELTIGNSAMADNLNADILEFIKATTAAMGLSLDVTLQDAPDGLHVDLDGEDGAVLLRRKGEALQALQHVANMAFRHRLGEQRRLIVDCQGFRRDKDVELRQMAKFMAERAKRTGVEQELGPLNPYERRIVHMTVAEEAGVSSHSVGDAFSKVVIISASKS